MVNRSWQSNPGSGDPVWPRDCPNSKQTEISYLHSTRPRANLNPIAMDKYRRVPADTIPEMDFEASAPAPMTLSQFLELCSAATPVFWARQVPDSMPAPHRYRRWCC